MTENMILSEGKSFPNSNMLKSIGREILNDIGRQCIPFTLLKKKKEPAKKIFFIGRHQDVIDVLKGKYKDDVDLSLFDDAMKSGVGEERIFTGEITTSQDIQWEILKQAMLLPPKMDRSYTDTMTEIADRSVKTAIAEIRENAQPSGFFHKLKLRFSGKKPQGHFNAIRDYGYLVPCLAAAEFSGIELPTKPTFWLKTFVAIRNVFCPGRIILKGNQTGSMQMWFWVTCIFAHLFGNFGDRNKGIRAASKNGSKQMFALIMRQYENIGSQSQSDILTRFKRVRGKFEDLSDCEYETYVRGLSQELFGAMHTIVGTAYAKVLDTLYSQNISIEDFVHRVEKNQFYIDEVLRMNVANALMFRTVINPIKIGGQTLNSGDTIGLLIDAASKDPRAFDKPDVISDFSDSAPKRDPINYLAFGSNETTPNSFRPSNNSHPCFGQYWSRTLLYSMFKGMLEFDNLNVKNENKPAVSYLMNIGTAPDACMLTFDLEPKIKKQVQTLVTICSRIPKTVDGSCRIKAVQKKLEKLGNPVDPQIKDCLQQMDTLHFISMHVIEGAEKQEPDYLLLEMSVDGPTDQSIVDLEKYLSTWLSGLYMTAGCIDNKEKLVQHLQDNTVEMSQAIWPEFYSNKWCTGVGFTGTDGQSVRRVLAEDKLSKFITERLNSLDGNSKLSNAALPCQHARPQILDKSDQSAMAQFRDIKEQIHHEENKDKVGDVLWTLKNSVRPSFAETKESPWKNKWGLLATGIELFPVFLISIATLIYLAITSSMWKVLFYGRDEVDKITKICKDVLSGVTKNMDIVCSVDLKNVAVFPFGSEEKMIAAGTKFLYIDASSLYGIFAASIAIAFLINTVSLRMKKIQFRKIGQMFWFVLGFFLILYRQFIDHILMFFTGKETGLFKRFAGPSDTLNLTTEYIQIFSGALLITVCFCIWRVIFTKSNRFVAAGVSLYMTLVLFGTIGLQQYTFMTFPGNAGGQNFVILNQFLHARLSDLIFYPLILSAVLTASLFLFRSTFPSFVIKEASKNYYSLWGMLFIAIFVTSFVQIGAGDSQFYTFLGNVILMSCMIFIIPYITACVIYKFFGLFMSPLIGGKYTIIQSRYSITLLFVILMAAFNLTEQPRGRISCMIADMLEKYYPNHFVQELNSPLDMMPYREKILDIIYSFGTAVPILIVILLAFFGWAWALLARSEKNNIPHDSDAEIGVIDTIMKAENQAKVHNHMISVTRILPEQFRRRITLPMSLQAMVTAILKRQVRPGDLGEVATVHFARWILLPETNNYVFVSNYDGSFESYLEDFITKLSDALNGAWSHSIGYPKVKNIFQEGSKDGDRFIRWARGSMRPTPFWYSAYDTLSVEQIRRNALVRDGLARINSASDAEAWLDLFGSVTRPEHALQTDQIQSLVFGGSGKLPYGCCLSVQNKSVGVINKDNPVFQHWLNLVRKHVTYGEGAPHIRACYLALSAQGLKSAGLGEDLRMDVNWKGDEQLDGQANAVKFSSAFALGMNSETRANILADTGKSAQENWTWGGRENPTHAVIILHASTKQELDKLRKLHVGILAKANVKTGSPLKFHTIHFANPDTATGRGKRLPREPFGFVDGVSNPIIRGTIRAAKKPGSIHIANPGEFILGYKGNRGYFPSSPQIETFRDHLNILPATPNNQPQKYPYFQDDGTDKIRDLGRNGTYLVVRQLEQDVEAFQTETLKKAQEIFPEEFKQHTKGPAGKKTIESRSKHAQLATQAKMMGRWHDGRPLVSDPVRVIQMFNGSKRLLISNRAYASGNFDNEFLYGRDDPQGHACPYGSHIRRSNPRDSFRPDDEDELKISNRHRIMRRGRTYTEGNKGGKTGIMFMCVNTNIQRQFEFVQQTWLGASNFHGLRNEIDPIAGQNSTNEQGFTIQTPGKDQQISNLKSFVTMKGGGYFFMPSRDALLFIATACR